MGNELRLGFVLERFVDLERSTTTKTMREISGGAVRGRRRTGGEIGNMRTLRRRLL